MIKMPGISLRLAGGFSLMLAMLLAFTGVAAADPILQLNIGGGFYDLSTQTIVAGSNPFTLYAYLRPDPSKGATLLTKYYLSAAISPIVGPPGGPYGSFVFNGITYSVTENMSYGIPPWESNIAFDPGDLSKHGIFETYFREFEFTFNQLNRTSNTNTQDNPGTVPSVVADGPMYFQSFSVDTSALNSNYVIHFDLYTEKIKNGDTDVRVFAPFSHDAESGHPVPEPTSLILLGSGLMGVVAFGRFGRLFRK